MILLPTVAQCVLEMYTPPAVTHFSHTVLLQEKRRLLNQVDSLELALQIKADEVKELKEKLEAEVKGRLEDQHHHEQVGLKNASVNKGWWGHQIRCETV